MARRVPKPRDYSEGVTIAPPKPSAHDFRRRQWQTLDEACVESCGHRRRKDAECAACMEVE